MSGDNQHQNFDDPLLSKSEVENSANAEQSLEKSPQNKFVRNGSSRRSRNHISETTEEFLDEYPDDREILSSCNGSLCDLTGPVRSDAVAGHLPVPPDGGYGWVIVFGAFFCNFFVDGIANSFGPFMNSYQTAFGASKAGTSVIGSLLIGVYLLSGPIAGGLLNNYGARFVVIIGAILSTVAFILSTFSPNIYVHYVLYGFFGGIGFGFIYLPAIVIVSLYFENKRALATGIAVAGSGFGTAVIPVLSKHLIEVFDWRVALYVFAGFIFTCLFCGYLFKPLPMAQFDEEIAKQRNFDEDQKREDFLSALYRAGAGDTSSSIVDDDTNPTTRAPTRTRTESECAEAADNIDDGVDQDRFSDVAAVRPPLSPIAEGKPILKSRAGSQLHRDGAERERIQTRLRNATLTSTNSELTSIAGQSRTNLNTSGLGQLSRISARDYAQSIGALSRISQIAPAVGNIRAGESLKSVATSGIDPREFTRPLSRHDIFLQGSIRNLREFESEGCNFNAYRESQISIPVALATQEVVATASQMNGDAAQIEVRFSQGLHGKDCYAVPSGDFSKFKWIPLSVRTVVAQMLDLPLLKNYVMLLICISNIFGMFGFYIPFVYIIDLAKDREIGDATFLLSIIGFTNTFGRVFFGWVADKQWVSALAITNWSLMICGAVTCLCPLFSNFSGMALYSAVFGFIIAAYICLTSIVLTDLLGVERLTSSFGLVVVSRGIASLLGTPLAGIVYDLTNSYDATFLFSGVLIMLSGVLSCAIPFADRYERSQLTNEGDDEPQKDDDGRLSVLTERSEENLTEYQRTIQSLNQQRQFMQELEEYRRTGDNQVVNEEEEPNPSSNAENDKLIAPGEGASISKQITDSN